ncbi:FtsX-like permease family protein [Actinocorallia sp. A-T 12471]|uniref:FtsX-like permease family protein n=1 Tax=Actinocorallia sp. A-T 12471 TaxID=3089813 RepID=UPI0029D29457|nr:FtsX-like permease family protein [Actinocorallia sp. A-T 12471]MDX6738615.1 FtsX-like permease family protein [Actinocorallia sp. A-T 12471]
MVRLALSSLRHRTAAFVAVFLALFLGAALVMSFGSLLDTGLTPGLDAASAETLTIMGGVVGGWSLLLVGFAAVTTTTLGIRQRAREVALLKSAGATPRQLTRMILAEVLLLAVVAAALAIPVGVFGGRTVLGLVQDSGQVTPDVTHVFGATALGQGFGITVLSAAGAAFIAARRAARVRVVESMTEAAAPTARLTARRAVCGVLLLAGAAVLFALTVVVGPDLGLEAQALAGYIDILAAVALACFAPVLVRGLRVPGSGAAATLARGNLRARTGHLSSALAPVVLFLGMAVGTLALQEVDATASQGMLPEEGTELVRTLNYVITGMVAAFLCILLVNTLATSTAARRREFAQLRLAGATPGQILAMVALESSALALAGTLLGLLAAAATVLPYSYARTDSWLPDFSPTIPALTVFLTLTVALATPLLITRSTLRQPPLTATTP